MNNLDELFSKMKNLYFLTLIIWLVACQQTTSTLQSEVAGEATDVPMAMPTGSLILLDEARQTIDRLDVETLTTETVWQVPENGWVYQLDVSPDGAQIALAFTPPPTNRPTFDRSGVFLMPADSPPPDTFPTLLLGNDQRLSFDLNPIWSPDGSALYYTRRQPGLDSTFTTTIYRYDFATDSSLPIADEGIWLRPSPDGSQVTYVVVDPLTLERGLVVANSDGTNARQIIPIGQFFDVDAPVFSPDGKWLYFAVAETPPESSLFDKLTGVQPAFAHSDHNVPSDWWRVRLAESDPEQVTDQQSIIIYGDFDAMGNYLYYTTTDGVFALRIGDGQVQRLVEAGVSYRTMAWVE